MDLYGYRVGEKFKWNDETFEIQAVLPDDYLQIYSLDINQSKVERKDTLDKAYAVDELIFLPKYQTPGITKGDQPYYRERAFNDFEEWKQMAISKLIMPTLHSESRDAVVADHDGG
jgi:hypothetical protein